MFISRVKAKGQYYYYACIYDGSHERGKRSVYALGKKEKALHELSSWRNQSTIPGNLIDLGLKIENLDKWREKIEAV